MLKVNATVMPGVFGNPRKMYIDVDGVLVVWDDACSCIELARGFGRLMRFCLLHRIEPYWLSRWSADAHQRINSLLWPSWCRTMANPMVLNMAGGGNKAHAVDYDSDFVWIEDGLMPADADYLRERDCLDRVFITDGRDPDCLMKFMDFAAERLRLPPIVEWHENVELPFRLGPGG